MAGLADYLSSFLPGSGPAPPIPAEQNIFGGPSAAAGQGLVIGPSANPWLTVGGPPQYRAPVAAPAGMSRLQLPASMQPAPAALPSGGPAMGVAPSPPVPSYGGQGTGALGAVQDMQPAGVAPTWGTPVRRGSARPNTGAAGKPLGAPFLATPGAPVEVGGGARGGPVHMAPGPVTWSQPPPAPASAPSSGNWLTNSSGGGTPAAHESAITGPGQTSGGGRGGGGGFHFGNLTAMDMAALQAFLPREQTPQERAQRTIVDAANQRAQSFLAGLGRPPTKDEYDTLVANYEKWTQPVTIGPGMAQLMAQQYGGGMSW